MIEGDASLARHFAAAVPADLVLVCGVFGNISADDIAATVAALPSFCAPGASVIWTRHRRPPDLTPAIRALVRCRRVRRSDRSPLRRATSWPSAGIGWWARPAAFDPERRLFEFTGDGGLPA